MKISHFNSFFIGHHNANTMPTYIGLNPEEFEYVFRITLPSLLGIFKREEMARSALYIFLMKLRTGHTNAEIAPIFGMSETAIQNRIRKVRIVVHRDFVPLHLFNWNREDLVRNTSALSRQLYNLNENAAVVTFDGTYIYTIMSSNFGFQKQTFSVQKHRNLVKAVFS